MEEKEDKRFTLRIDPDLFEQVVQEAHQEHRSVGRQIEAILAKHFEENTHQKQ